MFRTGALPAEDVFSDLEIKIVKTNRSSHRYAIASMIVQTEHTRYVKPFGSGKKGIQGDRSLHHVVLHLCAAHGHHLEGF